MSKGQSHKHSAYEILADMVIAFFVSLGFQIWAFPYFGINVPVSTNTILVVCFTIISMIRRWITRRLFNWIHVKWG